MRNLLVTLGQLCSLYIEGKKTFLNALELLNHEGKKSRKKASNEYYGNYCKKKRNVAYIFKNYGLYVTNKTNAY